jgi:hypothetical protein
VVKIKLALTTMTVHYNFLSFDWQIEQKLWRAFLQTFAKKFNKTPPSPGCAISKCAKFETPLYDLITDSETVSYLYKSELFTDFDIYDDENEHSLEMQYPYIAKVGNLLVVRVGNLLVA